MSTNNTYKHTNLIFSPGREKNNYEFQFKPSLKKINKMDSQIFTFTPRQNRRELKSVNRLNTDHSPEFFYDNYSPREQPRSPVKQIVVHSPKSITPRQKQLSNLISWDNHDSILHRFDELSKYKPKSNYKNASSFSDYQQINKSKDLTKNIMKVIIMSILVQQRIKTFRRIQSVTVYFQIIYRKQIYTFLVQMEKKLLQMIILIYKFLLILFFLCQWILERRNTCLLQKWIQIIQSRKNLQLKLQQFNNKQIYLRVRSSNKQVIANDNKQYKEYGAGPQFDQNGVIQRSIVGKAEEFNRLKSLSLASIKFMQGGQSAAQKFAHRLSQKRISMIVKKNPTNDMQESKSTKRPKDYEIITKYDIIAKSKQAAQRILENERNYKKQLAQMPLAERLLKTKEERILQKFQEQQKIWQDEVAKVSLLSNRQMNDTVISHSNQYRKKVEQNEMNEALKQFEGEATTNMWYMSLRRNTSKEQQDKSKLLQDVKSNTILVDYTNKPIEVIRQQSFYSSNHSRLNSTGTFYSMNQTQNKLPFFKYTNLQDDNLEGFIVEGQNVLKQETDQLLLDTSDQQQFKLYKQQDE